MYRWCNRALSLLW